MVDGPYNNKFELDGEIEVDLSDKGDLMGQIIKYDQSIFDSVTRETDPKAPYWGQVFVNSLAEPEA